MTRRVLFLILGIAWIMACQPPAIPAPTPTLGATFTASPMPTLVRAIRATPTGMSEPTPDWTVTPFQFPAAIPPTPICEGALRSRLILYERGRVLDDDDRALRMRSGPGTSYEIVAQIRVNQVFLVLEGPRCGEGYTWFLIQYRGVEGWIAEGSSDGYFVEPYLPG